MSNAYAVLYVQLPAGQEDAWPVTEPLLTLGRSSGCHVVLEDTQVSRQHAEIAFGPAGVQVRDLGSANGTWLNDQALPPRSPVPLRPGDVLHVGPFRLRLAPPQEPLPPALGERVRASSRPQPGLLVQFGGQVAKFPLPADKDVLTLGRASDNDLVIPAPVISGHHARLERESAGYRIVDLGSTNGLLVSGRRVQQQSLHDGDAVSVLDQVWIQYRQSIGLLPAERPTPPPAPVMRRLDPTAQPQITIGRSAENDVFLDDPRVSRRHALIERMGARFRLRDLRSDNGTFVNGQRIKDTVWLQPGDEIRIANVQLAFAQDGLQQLEFPFGLRLDALHLNKWVAKDKNILQDLSFSILPREFVALVGVSGAGKSTLMDALNGFRPATQGTVLINGVDLYKEYDSFRSELGYVPQDDIMHRELTVGKALDYAAQLRMPADTSPAERRRRVAEVLSELGLADRKDMPIDKLSGGQRKRVSIGIELITKPGLFFLDEATSGLDPGTEAELMRLLRQLADDGRTIVLVTHATKNVMMCDKVIFLAKGGYLAFFGPPEEALTFFDRYRSDDNRLLQPEIDFDDIYRILEDPKLGTPAQWAERYRLSDAFKQYVAGRLARAGGEGERERGRGGERESGPGERTPAGAASAGGLFPAPVGDPVTALPGRDAQRPQNAAGAAAASAADRPDNGGQHEQAVLQSPGRAAVYGYDDALSDGDHRHVVRHGQCRARDHQGGAGLPARAHGQPQDRALHRLQDLCGGPVRRLPGDGLHADHTDHHRLPHHEREHMDAVCPDLADGGYVRRAVGPVDLGRDQQHRSGYGLDPGDSHSPIHLRRRVDAGSSQLAGLQNRHQQMGGRGHGHLDPGGPGRQRRHAARG